jgi:hypothetical protein
MAGQPVASLRRFVGGGGTVEVFSSAADQSDDARIGSAAAMMMLEVESRLVCWDSFFTKFLSFVVSGLRRNDLQWLSNFDLIGDIKIWQLMWIFC